MRLTKIIQLITLANLIAAGCAHSDRLIAPTPTPTLLGENARSPFSTISAVQLNQLAAAEPGELILLSTTDFHASLDKAEAIAATVTQLKQKFGDHLLYLDAGDQFQGSLEGNLSKGKAIVAFFNHIGLDVAAIGNHELDYGPNVPDRTRPRPREDGLGALKARVSEAHYPWLSANLVYRGQAATGVQQNPVNALGQRTVFQPHAIFQRAGYKVCVIGATTPGTAAITRPEFVRDVEFRPLEEVVAAEARSLRSTEHCDRVVLVTHAGLLCNTNGSCLESGDRAEIVPLLRSLPAGTVDAVIAGHTHLLGQEVVQETPILEAGSYAKAVGLLRLKKDGSHRFESFLLIDAPPTQISAANQATSAAIAGVTKILAPFRAAAATRKNRTLGVTVYETLPKLHQEENALCNLVADGVLDGARRIAPADRMPTIALVNAGGIRADLPKGRLHYGDLFKVLPFENSLAVVQLTGAQLRRLLEIGTNGSHGLLCTAGLQTTLQPNAAKSTPRDLNGDGKFEQWEQNWVDRIAVRTRTEITPLDDTALYWIATSDFLMSGGDHSSHIYDGVAASRKSTFPDTSLRDAVGQYVQRIRIIRPSDFLKDEGSRRFLLNPVR